MSINTAMYYTYLHHTIINRRQKLLMRVLLSIIHIVVAIVLIAIVLLQQRKQGGFSGVFGGGTQADSGQWQRFTGATKLTIILASVFMVTSFFLVFIS